MCWRKGHGGDPSETCPFATLKEASRQRNQWSHVRCAACGERGVADATLVGRLDV